MREVAYKDLEIGMLIVPDPDCFMLGCRWIVEEKQESGSFYCKAYSCGMRSEWNCSDMIITEKSTGLYERPDGMYWIKDGETLESWRKKFEKKENS
jgi:hypothetical protein